MAMTIENGSPKQLCYYDDVEKIEGMDCWWSEEFGWLGVNCYPLYELDVCHKGDSGTPVGIMRGYADVNAGPVFNLCRGRGTKALPQRVMDGDVLGQLAGVGWAGAAFKGNAKIRFVVDGTAEDGQFPPTKTVFFTGQSGSGGIDRMEVRADGTVQVFGMFRCGTLGVGNAAAGSTLGAVVKKIEVFDASGASLGYVPVYDTIS